MSPRYPNLAWLAANAPTREAAQAILRAIKGAEYTHQPKRHNKDA